MVGADAHHKTSVPVRAFLRLPRHRRRSGRARGAPRTLLDFVGIAAARTRSRANLSYGDQRRLEIARALATRPEAAAAWTSRRPGFNPAEKAALMQLIRKIRDTGVTVLLIEHDMQVVMGVCDRIVVLEFGEKIAEGAPGEVQQRPEGDRGVPRAGARRQADGRRDDGAHLDARGDTSTCTTARIQALKGISLQVGEGEIVTLIGANGAGRRPRSRRSPGCRRPSTGRSRSTGSTSTSSARPRDRRAGV